MDRDEALRLLKGGEDGVHEWNQRRERGEEIPDLRGADLVEAHLSGADLVGAHLSAAVLGGALLIGADLRGADLRGAGCGRTVFGDVDLSEVKGLEAVQHSAPSTVGVDTLVRSRGRIPEAFLRGCGVPATWIEFLKWKDHDSFQAAFGRLIEDLKATTSDERGHPPARP